jgi:hypothetical protein
MSKIRPGQVMLGLFFLLLLSSFAFSFYRLVQTQRKVHGLEQELASIRVQTEESARRHQQASRPGLREDEGELAGFVLDLEKEVNLLWERLAEVERRLRRQVDAAGSGAVTDRALPEGGSGPGASPAPSRNLQDSTQLRTLLSPEEQELLRREIEYVLEQREEERRKRRQEKMIEGITQYLARQLELTELQVESVRNVMREHNESMEQLYKEMRQARQRQGDSFSPDQFRRERQTVYEQTAHQIRQVLTAEQVVKFDELWKRFGGRPGSIRVR